MLEINENVRIPLEEMRFTYARSAGPGGQNVNKVNSKVILHWDVTNTAHLSEEVKHRFLSRYRTKITTLGEIVISGQRYRDQPRNIDDCLDRLREMITDVLIAPVIRKPTKPSRSMKLRRLREKREQSERKASRKKPQQFDRDD